ncbi:MAG TPA: redox-sensing transcriptional repressor Rex [Roseiflexaceae bacterium]
MERVETPPDVVIRRLPLYARSLRALLQQGVTLVSSHELGARINVTAAQIRKDLSLFGEFGQQGRGYEVEQLLRQIERILGLTQEWRVALVGIGHLGTAIARHEEFHRRGIRIAALFDSDPHKIGATINGMSILGADQIPEVIRAQGIKLAIIAVPARHAQAVADQLIAAGVRAILNYAPIVIQVPDGVWIRDIDPVIMLHSMTYYLAHDEATHVGIL